MPIYEYGCKKCGHEFEVLIRRSGDVPGKCPKCGAAKPAKMLSAFAVSVASGGHDHGESCAHCPSADSCGCSGGTCGLDD